MVLKMAALAKINSRKGQARMIDAALLVILLNTILIIFVFFTYNNLALDTQIKNSKEAYVHNILLTLLNSYVSDENKTYVEIIAEYLVIEDDSIKDELKKKIKKELEDYLQKLNPKMEWVIKAKSSTEEFCMECVREKDKEQCEVNDCSKIEEKIFGRDIYVASTKIILPTKEVADLYVGVTWD